MDKLYILQTILIVLLLFILCGVSVKLFQLLSVTITRMKMNQIMQTYNLANKTIKDIVKLSANQVNTEYVKPRKATGKFTQQDEAYSLHLAQRYTKELINPKLIDCHKSNILNIDRWITMMIEECVSELH